MHFWQFWISNYTQTHPGNSSCFRSMAGLCSHCSQFLQSTISPHCWQICIRMADGTGKFDLIQIHPNQNSHSSYSRNFLRIVDRLFIIQRLIKKSEFKVIDPLLHCRLLYTMVCFLSTYQLYISFYRLLLRENGPFAEYVCQAVSNSI